MLSINLC